MNKKILVGVVVLLLLASGAYAMKTKQSTNPGPQTESQAMGEAAEFAKAMESGKPTTCVMTKSEDSMEYHLKGKMMAANITAMAESKSTRSHMINDEKYLYMWTDDSKQGSKMSLAVPSPSIPSTTDYSQSAREFDSEADYDQLKNEGYTINCKAGTFSDSVFTPPSNIEFIDPSAMMKAIPSPNAAGEYDMSQLKELQKQYGGISAEDQ